MKSDYQISWTTSARYDLNQIIKYISIESPSIALKILDKIEDNVSQIKNHPKKGRYIPELEKNNILKYRESIVSPWRIFYKIEQNKVYIMAVIDGRRNIEDILLRRRLK